MNQASEKGACDRRIRHETKERVFLFGPGGRIGWDVPFPDA